MGDSPPHKKEEDVESAFELSQLLNQLVHHALRTPGPLNEDLATHSKMFRHTEDSCRAWGFMTIGELASTCYRVIEPTGGVGAWTARMVDKKMAELRANPETWRELNPSEMRDECNPRKVEEFERQLRDIIERSVTMT